MGNHRAGIAMGKAAEMALKMRTNQTAIELLDMICEPYRGCDAEFEAEHPDLPGRVHPEIVDYTDPNGPLGVLIVEAFGESGCDYMRGWPEDEESVKAFYYGPYNQFSERYEFC